MTQVSIILLLSLALLLGKQVNADAIPTPEEATKYPSLESLRILYFHSVLDEHWVHEAEKMIQYLEPKHETNRQLAKLRAYEAALEIVMAKHATWPTQKLEHLNRGEAVLDELARAYPDSLEIRFLRMISGFYLPWFFGRKDIVEQDLNALTELVQQGDHGQLSAIVANFLLDEWKDLPKAQLASVQQVADTIHD